MQEIEDWLRSLACPSMPSVLLITALTSVFSPI